MNDTQTKKIIDALNAFKIELPSWGFADTGTRFGKFLQDAAADTIDQKFHDAGVVHKLTGAAPTVAVHVEWDFAPDGDPTETAALAESHGLKIGSINPTLFTDQRYSFGSLASPSADARQIALEHTLRSIEIGAKVHSSALAIWLADGTNYPGQDNLRARKHRLHESFAQIHEAMAKHWPTGTMLIEYKPFEPAFYHTDVADWGMSYAFCKNAGPQAKVLVDTGHHLPGANIEHLVAFLLDENMLGGFHFNDRKYADDDLTLGSVDPYAAFRIFDQIAQYEHDTASPAPIEYMIDQSHNLKPKLEAMVQTVCEAQKMRARAALVDRKALAKAQKDNDIVAAESLLKQAFETDPTPALQAWRQQHNLPLDPLAELRSSGLIEQLGKQRTAAREAAGVDRNTSYA